MCCVNYHMGRSYQLHLMPKAMFMLPIPFTLPAPGVLAACLADACCPYSACACALHHAPQLLHLFSALKAGNR